MVDRETLARLWRVAPFAAVAILGVGVLVVPDPDRSAADSQPAGLVAITPAGGGTIEVDVEVATNVPEPVTPPAVALPPPQPAAPVTTTTAVPRTTTTVAPIVTEEPLRITASGWSSATGPGTPVGAAGIPDDALPVGSRPDGPDKVSWIRLAGNDTELVLQPMNDPGANRFETDATIRLCRATVADWATGANLDPAETPPVDETRCADGVRADDGSWSFALDRLGRVDDARGAVLLPGDGLFQVTFATVQGEPG